MQRIENAGLGFRENELIHFHGKAGYASKRSGFLCDLCVAT
jgi:hypothetical protein